MVAVQREGEPEEKADDGEDGGEGDERVEIPLPSYEVPILSDYTSRATRCGTDDKTQCYEGCEVHKGDEVHK